MLANAIQTLSTVMLSQSQSLTTLQGSLNADRQGQNQLISMASVHDTIREFHGNEGPESARAWINDLKNTKTLHSWSEEVTLSVAKVRLRNGAWKWLMNKGETVQSFQNFEDAFVSAFTYSRTRSEKLKIMSARVQKPNEILQDYVLDKIWLCKGLDFSVGEIRDPGLWSRELSHYVLGREYASTDAMLQDLVKVVTIRQTAHQ
ncbi:uncharacterized protein LOC143305688 [Osmia lignaria lignaria]|uniref:uncharacterized protein LOC143305688 n=1 Tax=Osmia lignaria lignaria TaxID=1437193 RepID=UPI00402BE04A